MMSCKQLFSMVLAALVLSLTAINSADALKAEILTDMIETLEIGDPIYHQNLTVIPIYSTSTKDHSQHIALDEALKHGWLQISEVDGGSVPQVRVTNRSSKHIFLMGGEILTGCRQDRIIGRDVLVKPNSKNIIVPVYCVEEHRWNYQSDNFYSKSNLGTYGLRAESQKATGKTQGHIWKRVSGINERLGVRTGTNAYQSAYEDREISRRIGIYEDKFQHIPNLHHDAIGAVVGAGREIISVDIFANRNLFRKLWPKILKSSALSAVCDSRVGMLTQDDAIEFLRMLHDKHYRQKPAVDVGFELSCVDSDVNVNALLYRNAVIHVAGFPESRYPSGIKIELDSERRVPVLRRQ
ncbi:ARPP-1 family domain-containing protein [Candidatus Omnitrophota bacterium]